MRRQLIRLLICAPLVVGVSQSQQQKPSTKSVEQNSKEKTTKREQTSPPANPTPASGEIKSEKPAPKFDIGYIDKSLDPCVDFYQFACANWLKNNPIPADYPEWISFNEVFEHNLAVLHSVLERAAANDAKRSPAVQQIGDYYASCMDEASAKRKGVSPLKAEFARIAALKDKPQMLELMAVEAMQGPDPIFGFGAGPDLHNADMTIAAIDQSGMTMPDRDYYLKDDASTVAIRKAYVDHVAKMFTLMGQTAQQAAKGAETVLQIETELAKAAMDRTKRRDPKNRDHKMTVNEIEAAAPNFHLGRYFAATGAPAFKELNVGNPDFFKAINTVIEVTPLDSWKTYMTWRVLNGAAGWLSDDFVQEDFKFRQALTGQKELEVRWKRCVNAVDGAMGEALGQPYVDQTFGVDGKQRMLKMVDALERALRADITSLPWMTDVTKREAITKLEAMRNKIGYPDKWRDYSKLKVVRDDMVGNFLRANAFESKRQLQKIGKPVDKLEWGISPPTVNAFYSGSHNEIVFPAGILQPPFFDRTMDDAVNFGGIGLVIGHELTHGFDDQGRKYDPKGNLRDWWTPQDGQEFEKRASCVADEYSSFTSVDDLKLNGRLTLGENTADNGGARIALMALHDLMKQPGEDANKKIDGFTPDQRYFLGFARVWCENRTDELARLAVRTDPHSPGRWRVNGVVQNMPEFQEAFSCKAGQPMVRQNACRVW